MSRTYHGMRFGRPRQWTVGGAFVIAVGLAGSPAALQGQIGPAALDTVRAGRFDAGKMWTFEYAPKEYFSQTYGFDANDAWFERARLAALRIPGCSASFVSPFGLLATNHHCVRSAVSRVTRPGETLLDSGFYATSLDLERPIPGYYADQLIAVEDISEEVFSAMDRAPGEAARDAARREMFESVGARLRRVHAGGRDSVWVQLIGLYNGGRYSAYVFRRFTDIRLVAAAELQMGFFGGDPDNFTYPRYALDFAFLRVYGPDGRPYQTDHYFGWGTEGVEEGDVVFVIGNPGPTDRLNTVAQLDYQREVELPPTVSYLTTRLAAMDAFRHAFPEQSEAWDVRNRMFSLSNSLKATAGRLAAVRDPTVMAKRRDAERRLAQALRGNSQLAARYGGVLDRIAEIQAAKAKLAAPTAAFVRFGNPTYSSTTLLRAVSALELLAASARGAPADSLATLRDRLLRTPDKPRDLEHRFLEARLRDFAGAFGASHDITRAALRGATVEEAAATLLRGSVLAEVDRVAEAIRTDRLRPDDPAVQLAAAFVPVYAEYSQELGRLSAQERELEAQLGRARFEVLGDSIAPDATSSPRITDGVVMGYEYNGTEAPPYTTFYGLYDRYHAHRGSPDWELPARWRTPPAGFDLRTPLNFVSTADSYGGNSGSPAVTRDLGLVGLNFDRNIEGLSRAYIYLPEQGRNIMVDVRAIHAALDHVYDADRIVLELTTERLFRTEAEADAVPR